MRYDGVARDAKIRRVTLPSMPRVLRESLPADAGRKHPAFREDSGLEEFPAQQSLKKRTGCFPELRAPKKSGLSGSLKG